MKNLFAIIAFCSSFSFGALATTLQWEVRSTATAGNVNGGGFDSSIASAGTDYSQQDAGQWGTNDLACVAAGAVVVSAGSTFTNKAIGNVMHITTTGTGGFYTVGWYEVTGYTDSHTLTLDRTPCAGGTGASGTFQVGGAMSLNATGAGIGDNAFLNIQTASSTAANKVWVKAGTYTIGENVTFAAAGNAVQPIKMFGYNTTRGDNPPGWGLNAPKLLFGAFIFLNNSGNWSYRYLNISGTATPTVSFTASNYDFCFNKVKNISTTATQTAISTSAIGRVLYNEIICYRGNAVIPTANGGFYYSNYIHASDVGVSTTQSSGGANYIGNIFSQNVTTDLDYTATTSSPTTAMGNTFLGGIATPYGTAIKFSSATQAVSILNNIIYGKTSGISGAAAQSGVYSDYNDFFNNTTARTNVMTGTHDVAVNPFFFNFSILSQSTAKSASGNKLIQASATWAASDTLNYLQIVSGTGVTAGIYGISSISGDTLVTDVTLAADATTNKVWRIVRLNNANIQNPLLSASQTYPGNFFSQRPAMGAVKWPGQYLNVHNP